MPNMMPIFFTLTSLSELAFSPPPVILSGVAASLREAAAQSKDLCPMHGSLPKHASKLSAMLQQ